MQVFSCINCDFKDKFQMRCINFPEENKFYCSCNYSFMGVYQVMTIEKQTVTKYSIVDFVPLKHQICVA